MLTKVNKTDYFTLTFINEILEDLCMYHNNNIDFERIGCPPERFSLICILRKLREGFRKQILRFCLKDQHKYVTDFLKNGGEDFGAFLNGLTNLFDLLGDSNSKQLLIKILAFRALGKEHVKLPLNTPEYWEQRKFAYSLIKGKETIAINFMNWKLRRFNLNKINFPIELYLVPMAVTARFILKNYEYINKNVLIKAESGDFVIDAGGWIGDSALYFAHEVGANGKVFSFEFVPESLEIMRKNFELNPSLKDRIEIVNNPLWDESQMALSFENNGPGTKVLHNARVKVSDIILTISIDDYVDRNSINRIDFIKMDIEGSELKALKGAEKTIRKYRPKLAISLYHNLSDFVTIPEFLQSLQLDYEFFLGHYTIHTEETVLFGQPKKTFSS